ncbi:SapC family protein [Sphingomonas nostoxanthinifaciens]|uniref:SapC family protein n=1 Tax=Sphingomonas nostoxanthinifaciens TaxID=2872652 RepID=UPI001CC20E86|nr:SapC family protein [Sphingomonas nostoxanthinifaciens]UAK24313.1 SapC family protein [Sphingomonas nostoxanthinifaciens]
MTDIEVLNASLHGDLRVRDAIGSSGTQWRGFVEIVLAEFAVAATRYPIFFTKNYETGRFMAGILHGIQSEGQVRSLGSPDPDAYVPFAVQREGFFVSGDHLAIDPDDARVSRTEGRPLFDAQGEPATALKEVQQAVAMLMRGREPTAAFIDVLLQHKLIEPIAISLDFDDGERLNLDGLYTVSLDQMSQLDDAAVLALFRSNHLQLAYAAAASLRQLPILASQRNRRLADALPA